MSSLQFRESYFSRIAEKIHLASCSLAPRSTFLEASMNSMLDDMSGGQLAWTIFEKKFNEARVLFAKFIGAGVDQIAVLPNASVAAYQVISTIPAYTDSRILYTEDEFPSLAHIWQSQKCRGFDAYSLSSRIGNTRFLKLLSSNLNPNISLLSVPLTSYRCGRRYPIEQISKLSAQANIPLLIDAYQGLGAERIEIETIPCDYLICGSMKYMLGLPGVAFLYVKNANHNLLPPQLTGWLGRKQPFAFDSQTVDFPASARKFEIGTPAIPAIYAANAAMDVLLQLNYDKVKRHIQLLINIAFESLSKSKFKMDKILDAEYASHIAFKTSKLFELNRFLQNNNVIVSTSGGRLRLSCHYFNNIDEVEHACNLLCYFSRKFL